MCLCPHMGLYSFPFSVFFLQFLSSVKYIAGVSIFYLYFTHFMDAT